MSARRHATLLLLVGLSGCIENGFRGGDDAKIAVTYGDFDDLTPALDRLSVPHNIYDGIISNPTWSETDVAGVLLTDWVQDLLDGQASHVAP